MRAKFIPLTSFLLLLIGLGYAGWLAASRTSGEINTADILAFKQNSTDFSLPGKEEMASVQDISKKLILLAHPGTGTIPGVDLKLFGEREIVQQRNPVRRGKKEVTKFSYDITFTFVSDRNQYCYINDHFYQQGDVMPDGGVVSRIEAQQVLINKNNIAEWIPVTVKRK
ncbi:MAG: hypothetical protein U9R56_07740 [candidate division Zixibacteria bacterium]|nr:hypothetical protein [candidate division Zixibacteria bacterium]